MTRAASVPWSVLRPFHSLTPAGMLRRKEESDREIDNDMPEEPRNLM